MLKTQLELAIENIEETINDLEDKEINYDRILAHLDTNLGLLKEYKQIEEKE